MAAAAVLAAAQAVLVNVGTGLIDVDAVRPWAWLVWTVIGLLAVLGVVLGVVQYRRDRAASTAAAADGGSGAERVMRQQAHAIGLGVTVTQVGRDQITHIHPPPPPPAPVAPAACSNLPPRNPTFTGRETLLERVGRALAAGPVAVVAVRGLGGVGKSQTAVEYAHRGWRSGGYELAWQVRAETALTAAEDLAGLAPALGVPVAADQEETVAGVRAALQQRGRWLLVLDNAPDPQAVRGWLPTGPGHVLITSRDRGWASLGTQLDVDPFDRAESLAYLRARLGHEDPDADTLAEALGDLPLALAQAAAYLEEHGGLSVAGYLMLYRNREAAGRLLARQTGDGYPESVATTWLIHLADLATSQPAALELLRVCAHLDPDDIDLTLLLSRPELLDAEPTRRLAAAARTPGGVEDAVGALTRTSLFDRLDDHRLRVHRLVADITRRHLTTVSLDGSPADSAGSDSSPGTAWAAHAVGLLLGLFPDQPWESLTWPTSARLAAHARAAAGYATSIAAVDGNLGRLLARVGVYLWSRADQTQAMYVADEILRKRAASEAESLEFTCSYGRRARIQHLQELAAARTSQERALAIEEAVYRPQPAFAIGVGDLGLVQRELGELAAARANLERALAILQTVYEPAHPEFANTLVDLGCVHLQRGELGAARASLELALPIFEAVYGPEHPRAVWTRDELALINKLSIS